MSNYGAIIAGTGSALPEKRLTNDDLSKMVDTNDQWIVQRTGIRERRIAGPGESTATLATAAARRALESAGIEPRELDLIICGTISPEMTFPSTACFVAAALGLNSTPAFDVAAACSGFLYTLQTGVAFVKSGLYRNVLVIGAETLSRLTDYTDRGSCILFGDGAGAMVLKRSNDPAKGVIYGSLHSDGHGWEMLYCQPGSRHPASAEMIAGRNQYMKIKGREVYKFAVQRFEELIEDAMRKCELTPDTIKLIVPHQVNQRIIDSAMHKLGIGSDKAFVNIDRYGNTSAASIPIDCSESSSAPDTRYGPFSTIVTRGSSSMATP